MLKSGQAGREQLGGSFQGPGLPAARQGQGRVCRARGVFPSVGSWAAGRRGPQPHSATAERHASGEPGWRPVPRFLPQGHELAKLLFLNH